jgi:hypothetical protein
LFIICLFISLSDDPEERARQRAEKRKARREAAANKARQEVAAFKQSLAEPEAEPGALRRPLHSLFTHALSIFTCRSLRLLLPSQSQSLSQSQSQEPSSRVLDCSLHSFLDSTLALPSLTHSLHALSSRTLFTHPLRSANHRARARASEGSPSRKGRCEEGIAL